MSLPNPIALGKYLRAFLTTLAAVSLSLGLAFYILPGSMMSFWPWPVKELAVRFLGAIFLAIALGCSSAIRVKLWQRAKILVLVGGAFFELTGIISLIAGIIMNATAAIWIWTSYFLVGGTGCLSAFKFRQWHRKQSEVFRTRAAPSGSRVFFGIQTSVVGVFGLMMIALPGLAQEQFWPWKVATPTLQTFGALFLATCLATGWAFFQKDSERIRVLLPLDAIFPFLALLAVGLSWNVIVAESPSWLVTAVWVGLYSFVAVGSTILYIILRPRSSGQA